MKDPDAKIWTIKGKSMTLIPRPHLRTSNKELLDWANKYAEGECVVTPTYIGFEHAKDAEAFEVMFALTSNLGFWNAN